MKAYVLYIFWFNNHKFGQENGLQEKDFKKFINIYGLNEKRKTIGKDQNIIYK